MMHRATCKCFQIQRFLNSEWFRRVFPDAKERAGHRLKLLCVLSSSELCSQKCCSQFGRRIRGLWSASCGVLPPIPADLAGCDPCRPPGNAAVVLRSRLKVRVVKELRGKMAIPNGISENGVLAADLDTEVGKQVMQYQVLNEVLID